MLPCKTTMANAQLTDWAGRHLADPNRPIPPGLILLRLLLLQSKPSLNHTPQRLNASKVST